MIRTIGFLMLAAVLTACQQAAPVEGTTVLVHGEPVLMTTHDGDQSWQDGNTVRMGLGQFSVSSNDRQWARLITHEVCHVIDARAGRPSARFPGGPDAYWGAQSIERWAETCSWLWFARERDDPSFVDTPPGVGFDPTHAPFASDVTLAAYKRLCEAEDAFEWQNDGVCGAGVRPGGPP